MEYKQKSPWGTVLGVVLFVIALVIILPFMFIGASYCGVFFMLLTGHPM